MSSLATNAITDASGGNTATINSYTPTESNMAGRNRIINGSMVFDQRNGGASVTVPNDTNFYTADRWQVVESSSCVLSAQQVTDAPPSFQNSLKITVTTAAGSVGASETGLLLQRIEGLNIYDLSFGTASASAVTVSFWVKSSITGTFGGAIKNGSANRSYPFSYTINAANTWEQKTATIPGDTTGTWLTSNGIGMGVTFDIGSGSSRRGTADAWAASNLDGVTGATSIVTTLNATWQITGVQLEAGSVATPFEHRQYGQELALCQRYALMIKNGTTSIDRFGLGSTVSATTVQMLIQHPVQFRAAATLTTTGTASDYQVYSTAVTACSAAPTIGESSQYNSRINFITAGGLTGGQVSQCSGANTNAYLLFSAEL